MGSACEPGLGILLRAFAVLEIVIGVRRATSIQDVCASQESQEGKNAEDEAKNERKMVARAEKCLNKQNEKK